MVKYSNSVIVPYARETVWKLMSDWSNISIWDLNITSSKLSANQPAGQIGVGTKYDILFSANGMENVKVNYTCIAFDAPSKCRFEGIATLFRSIDTVECEQVAEGTKVTAEFNLNFRGPLYPLSFLMNGAMQKTGPIVMKDIEKFLHDRLGEDN